MVINVAERQKQRAEEIAGRPRYPFYVVLENVRSMYNVGSAFRTSDACLVSKLYLSGYTACPPRKEISKTALGAEDFVPWDAIKDIKSISASGGSAPRLRSAKSEGGKNVKNVKRMQIIAVEQTETSVPYTEFKFGFPVCLVFGNEILGVSKETLKQCDAVVHIPMLGVKESLNVATAYGVVLYEVLRQYQRNNIKSQIINNK